MASVAASGSASLIRDPNLVSYALEQPGMLKSQDYKNNKVMHHFSWRLLYVIGIGLDIVTSTV